MASEDQTGLLSGIRCASGKYKNCRSRCCDKLSLALQREDVSCGRKKAVCLQSAGCAVPVQHTARSATAVGHAAIQVPCSSAGSQSDRFMNLSSILQCNHAHFRTSEDMVLLATFRPHRVECK